MSGIATRDTRQDDGGPDRATGVTPIAPGAVLVTVSGKLCGSRARALGARLEDLSDEGAARVVLDLRGLQSLDSLASFALEQALERGTRVHLVVRPSFEFDGFFAARALGRRGLRVHRSLDEALARVREVTGSREAVLV